MYDTTKPYKEQILQLIKKTWNSPHLTVKDAGPYPVFHRQYNMGEIDHTDGIGTKGICHWKEKTFNYAVTDALAMNLNDFAVADAIPYKTQVHLMVPEDDHAILTIMEILADECAKRQIVITGGETSIHNNLEGMELSLTMSAMGDVKLNEFRAGDWILALPSSGLHSNGLTLARKYLDASSEFLTRPTLIYYDSIKNLSKENDIHGRLHIAGGAWTRLKSVLNDTDIVLELSGLKELPSVYYTLYEAINNSSKDEDEVSDSIMYKTFNCGFGFIFAVDGETAQRILHDNIYTVKIGYVQSGNNTVVIDSAFSNKELYL